MQQKLSELKAGLLASTESNKQLLKEKQILEAQYVTSQDNEKTLQMELARLQRTVESHAQTIFAKEERKNIYKAEIQTQTFFAKELPEEFQRTDLSEGMKAFLAELRSAQKNWEKIETTPMGRRNQFKQGKIFFYQILLVEMMKGVLTVFNKMEKAAFSAPQREGSSHTSHISSRIREGYLKQDNEIINIDALPATTIILEDTWIKVIENFLKRVLVERGWKDLIIDSGTRKTKVPQKNIEQFNEAINSGQQVKLVPVDEKAENKKKLKLIKIELKQKFSAELSRPLKQAVAQLEQQSLTVEEADVDTLTSSPSKQKSKFQ